MKYFTRLAVVAALIMMPVFASADTNSDLAAQAQALLNQVAALQAQLTAQGGVSTGSGVSGGTVTSNANCPLIGRVLKLGSTGDDVTRLQRYLAVDPGVYPEGQTTGYYGALTEAAVKRWQVKYNIVSSGTADTTGYGVTGPRTAAAISLQCSTSSGGTGGSGANNTTSGPVGGFIQVSPVSGNAPLTVSVKATINTTNSCSGGVYTLSWGDGTVAQSLVVPSGTCSQIVQNYSHQYIYGGVYVVVLSAGAHQTSATVIVSGVSGPIAAPVSALSANPSSGTAPLSVTFSGTGTSIDYGDGSTGPTVSAGSTIGTISHTYTQAGTFTARSGGSSLTITVNAAPYTFGPLAVTPNVASNPLAVTASFDLQTSCTGYDLSWGDSTAHLAQSNSTSCGSGVVTKTFTHTYSTGGSYTIYLRRGADLSRGDSVSLVISN